MRLEWAGTGWPRRSRRSVHTRAVCLRSCPRALLLPRSGFTLLEVLVALVIVTAAGLGLLGAVAGQARAASVAAGKLQATVLAQEIQAQLQLLPRDGLRALDPAQETSFAQLPGYRWSASIRSVASAAGATELTVTVWSEQHRVTLTSLLPPPESRAVLP